MADLSDVEFSLVDALSGILFSAAYSDGDAVSSILGSPVRLYRGYPISDQLDADLQAGIAHVAVSEIPGMTRNLTRNLRNQVQVIDPVLTIAPSVSANTITINGSATAGQLFGVAIGTDGYVITQGTFDTPQSLAAAMAAIIPNASANGASLTVDTGLPIIARTAGIGTVSTIVHQQAQIFKVAIYAPDPGTRDAICKLVDAQIQTINHLAFSDGSFSGPIVSAGTRSDDAPQKAHLWYRELRYSVEYCTTVSQDYPQLMFPCGKINVLDGLPRVYGVQPAS